MTIRTYLSIPHGREAVFAGCDARSEERGVVVPLKRRVTQQIARRGASLKGFVSLARLQCCSPCECALAIRRGLRRAFEPVGQKRGSWGILR